LSQKGKTAARKINQDRLLLKAAISQGNRGIKEKNLWIIPQKTGTLSGKIPEFVRL
jgi:hypothetical protein